MDLISGS